MILTCDFCKKDIEGKYFHEFHGWEFICTDCGKVRTHDMDMQLIKKFHRLKSIKLSEFSKLMQFFHLLSPYNIGRENATCWECVNAPYSQCAHRHRSDGECPTQFKIKFGQSAWSVLSILNYRLRNSCYEFSKESIDFGMVCQMFEKAGFYMKFPLKNGRCILL